MENVRRENLGLARVLTPRIVKNRLKVLLREARQEPLVPHMLGVFVASVLLRFGTCRLAPLQALSLRRILVYCVELQNRAPSDQTARGAQGVTTFDCI